MQKNEEVMVKRSILVLLICLSIPLFLHSIANGKEYLDENIGYRVTLPVSWSKMSQENIEMINKVNAETSEKIQELSIPQYALGFQETNNNTTGYPQVMIQHLAPNAMSFPDESEIEQGIPDKKTNFDSIEISTKFKNTQIDNDRKTFSITGEVDIPNVGKITSISFFAFGKKGIVVTYCFCKTDDFDKYLPVFNSITDSIKFEEGFEYNSLLTSETYSRKPFYKVLINYAIGGSIGLCLYYLGVWSLRRLRGKK